MDLLNALSLNLMVIDHTRKYREEKENKKSISDEENKDNE